MRTYKPTTLTSIRCDICKKEIIGKFWTLTTHHEEVQMHAPTTQDWGNDSIDSYEHFDLCSRECINKALDNYINDCKNSYTQCFELEQDFI